MIDKWVHNKGLLNIIMSIYLSAPTWYDPDQSLSHHVRWIKRAYVGADDWWRITQFINGFVFLHCFCSHRLVRGTILKTIQPHLLPYKNGLIMFEPQTYFYITIYYEGGRYPSKEDRPMTTPPDSMLHTQDHMFVVCSQALHELFVNSRSRIPFSRTCL